MLYIKEKVTLEKAMNKKKKRLSILSAAVFAIFGVFLLQRSLAAAGQFNLYPSATSVVNGSNITVTVKVHPNSPIDSVQATVTYDQSKLQYVSTNSAGTAFPNECCQGTPGNGVVTLVRFISPGSVSGDATISQITFKAIGTGSSNIVASGSAALAGAGVSVGNGSVAINVTSPPTPPPATPPSTPPATPPTTPPGASPSTPPASPSTPPSSNPSPSTKTPNPSPSTKTPNPSPSSTPVTAPLTQPGTPQTDAQTQTTIEISKLQFRQASIKISGNKPFKASLKYGIGNEVNATTPYTALGTVHEISLDPAILIPGTTYSYVVITEDDKGNVVESQQYSLKTKGYKINLVVRGKNDKPLAKKRVTLFSEPMSSETDGDGNVTFTDVAPGEHTLEYEDGGEKHSQKIQVEDDVTANEEGETAADQNFSIVFGDVESTSMPIGVAIAVAVAVLLIAGIVIAKRTRKPSSDIPVSGFMPPNNGSGTTPGQQPPAPLSPSVGTDELLKQVPGVQRSNPGSLIRPNEDNDKKE